MHYKQPIKNQPLHLTLRNACAISIHSHLRRRHCEQFEIQNRILHPEFVIFYPRKSVIRGVENLKKHFSVRNAVSLCTILFKSGLGFHLKFNFCSD
jgi:hypothetical protein